MKIHKTKIVAFRVNLEFKYLLSNLNIRVFFSLSSVLCYICYKNKRYKYVFRK